MTSLELRTLILAQTAGSAVRLAWDIGDVACAESATKNKLIVEVKPMRISYFATFLAGRSLLRKIVDAQTNSAYPDAIRNICTLIVLMIQGSSERDIDPNDTQTVGMMGGLQIASIVSDADITAWRSACEVVVNITPIDIENARKAGN